MDIEDIEDIYEEEFSENTLDQILNGNTTVLSDILNRITTTNRRGNILCVDAFSGLNVRNRLFCLLTNGRYYDSLFLCNYLLKCKDFRDPITSYLFSKEDINFLCESINNLSVSETLQNYANDDENHSKCVKTLVVPYCEDIIITSAKNLLNSCELLEITSMNDLQNSFDSLLAEIHRCFGVLLQIQPLSASTNAIKISKYFIDAISEMSTENYLYEPSALLPIGATVKALCTTIIDCVTNHSISSSLLKLDSITSVKIIF